MTSLINDKREIRGWMMYDWANSAFSTTVVTALLGPYTQAIAESSPVPYSIFGLQIESGAIFPFAVSISVILQVLFLPLLGTIADYTNLKRRMFFIFAYSGAIATILLSFLRGGSVFIETNTAITLGMLLFILANLSFGAAIVFYNAFLPDIASPDQRDRVSSQGWALGYLGGGLLLLINFGLLSMIEDQAVAIRISIASAGIWWLVFTYLFPQKRLVQRNPAQQLPEGANYIKHGVRQLIKTFVELWRMYPMTLRYLVAFLIYNDGIQTVIVVSTAFAANELGVETQSLLLLVLMIQFVAFGGALIFGWLAARIGAKRAIIVSLVIWSGVVIFAFAFLYNETQLFVLGAVLAIVLGGSQALSRSLFSQMIPTDQEAKYFGFYEISERGTAWIGTAAFALALQMTGSQRIAIGLLIFFFIAGLILLSRVNVKQAMLDAGNDPTGVII
jgi:MFS transporter, UMF1 family